MSRPRRQLAVCLLLLAAQAPAAVSSWDEMQLRLLRQYSTPLRWDNVEGSPQWVFGPKPRRPWFRRVHLIRLQPGEEVVLHGDANTWLRLTGEGKTLNAGDVTISISTDASAFAETVPIKSIDPYSLVVALPEDKPALIRLARPLQAETNLVFAAFFSREQPFATLEPYRTKARLSGKTTRLRRDDEAASEPANLLQPNQSLYLAVAGPARLELVARLDWPLTEALREESSLVEVQLDDDHPHPLLLSPELDDRHRTRVNHSVKLVSNRMSGFFDVPEGNHWLTLRSSAPIYLSAFVLRHSDLLLPWLNAPGTNAAQVLQPAFVTVPPASRSESPRKLLDDADFVQRQQNAFRLAKDNAPVDAGAQAADWLNRISQTRRDYPAARANSDTLWRERTFYREILPSIFPAGQPVRQALIPSIRLLDLYAWQRPVAVFNPALEQICGSLSTAGFVPISPLPSPGLIYQLPQRSHESELQIAAVTSGSARTFFFVQLDDDTPVQIMLDPEPAVSIDELEPSAAFATLRVIEQAPQVPATFGSGCPVDEFDFPLSVLRPGIIELPLPQRTRRVHIYQEPNAAPISVSVAYRAAKPFVLGEAGGLALLSECGTTAGFQMISNPQTNTPNTSESLRWLHNQYLPLIRLFRAHSNDFTKSVELSGVPQTNQTQISSQDSARLTASAEDLEKRGRPVEALEVWNRLFWGGSAADQSRLALAVMRCLGAIGEEYLAEQYARIALLTSSGSQIPAEAVAVLENRARQADDTEQLEQLRVFLFLRCPCAQHLAGLIEGLALNSRDEMVLWAGLLLPSAERPSETMLAAALHLNWWQTFDQLVEELPDTGAKEFWRAQKHLAFFHFDEVERHLKQAGTKGSEMLQALWQGRQIRERLSAASLSNRVDALLAWEEWLSRQPGPTIWQTVPDFVYECAGTEVLFNCEENEYSPFFRAEPRKPVKLRFLGPVRLKLEARPILDLPFEQPVDDWLEVVEFGLTNRIPICQCLPNPSLLFTMRSNALVGLKTLVNLDWGPGLHEVDVSLLGRLGLIRVLLQQPVLPLRILPPLSPERVSFVLETAHKSEPVRKRHDARLEEFPEGSGVFYPQARRLAAPSDEQSAERRLRRNLPWGAEWEEAGIWWVSPSLAHPSAPLEERPSSTVLESSGLARNQSLRLRLRLPSEPGRSPACDAEELQALPQSEQWLAACRWKRWDDFKAWDDLPDTDRVSYWLATGRIREMLDSGAPRDLPQRLVTLLEVSEFFSPWREEAQCLAEVLAARTNCPPGCKKIQVRVTQHRTWDPLTVSPVSAGVQPFKVQSDFPQDPSLRIRRALLPPGPTNQFTIAAQTVYTATMELQHPSEVQVHAELARAGFSPLAPLKVSFQIDSLPARHLALTPLSQAVDTNLSLSDGSHLLRMWIEDPVVNQCVRIGFAGSAAGITNTVWSESFSDMASEKRFFFGATAAQPVRFSWTGPALLRLDEWQEQGLSSQLLFVPGGEQVVALPPSAGRTQSWFQVFVRSTQTNQVDARPSWSIREPEEVPPPQLHLPESGPLPQAHLNDYYHLGGQENGTWSASVLLAHRWPFEPFAPNSRALNEFVQTTAAYRKEVPSETLWFDTEAMGRVHRPGDVTVGLSEYIEGHPQILPIEWAWSGQAYVGTVGPTESETEGSLYTTLEVGQRRHLSRKLDWYPFAGLFAHYLSLSPTNAKPLTYIDQDLYTAYRHDHLWGGVLGNELEYFPWLDTVLKGDIKVGSNEDFSPDHWGMRFSWDQLMGPLRSEVAYEFVQWLADSNRKNTSLLQGIAAGLYGELWLSGRHRIEVGGQYRHDWPGSGNSYFLVISWDFSEGRGYRDYSPHRSEFLDLRTRHIPAAYNNSFQSQ